MYIETLVMTAQNRLATSVFDKLMESRGRLKTWVEHDLRKLIDTTVAERKTTSVAHMPRDLAKKSLGEASGSPLLLQRFLST